MSHSVSPMAMIDGLGVCFSGFKLRRRRHWQSGSCLVEAYFNVSLRDSTHYRNIGQRQWGCSHPHSHVAHCKPHRGAVATIQVSETRSHVRASKSLRNGSDQHSGQAIPRVTANDQTCVSHSSDYYTVTLMPAMVALSLHFRVAAILRIIYYD
jgi:hypothetical protein